MNMFGTPIADSLIIAFSVLAALTVWVGVAAVVVAMVRGSRATAVTPPTPAAPAEEVDKFTALAHRIAAVEEGQNALRGLKAEWIATLEQLDDLSETVERKRRRAAASASKAAAQEPELPQSRSDVVALGRARRRG